MKTERIQLDGIETGARMRPLNSARVDALVSSISEIGLRTPITVMFKKQDHDTRVILIAGNHRLEALRKLGHEFTDCIVVSDSDVDAQLWEIDENLIRSPLTPVEEAEHLAKRKELWEAREKARDQVGKLFPAELGYKKPPPQNDGFASETAEKLGDSKRIINLKISRAVGVIDEAKALIRGTRLDTGTYLDKLKRLSPNDQVSAAKRDLAFVRKEQQSIQVRRAPDPQDDAEVEERQAAAIMSAWKKASRGAQEKFLSRIDIPVMDRKAGAA